MNIFHVRETKLFPCNKSDAVSQGPCLQRMIDFECGVHPNADTGNETAIVVENGIIREPSGFTLCSHSAEELTVILRLSMQLHVPSGRAYISKPSSALTKLRQWLQFGYSVIQCTSVRLQRPTDYRPQKGLFSLSAGSFCLRRGGCVDQYSLQKLFFPNSH